jgi:hypothetical protein
MMSLTKLRSEYQKNYKSYGFKAFFYSFFIVVMIFSARFTESSASSLEDFLSKIDIAVKNQEKIEGRIAELESLLKVLRLRIERNINF